MSHIGQHNEFAGVKVNDILTRTTAHREYTPTP
jgi:hypothetical protein